jgi:hypothetical protein
MRGTRGVRRGVGIAIAAAVLVVAAPAQALFSQPPLRVPAVVAGGGQTLLAWGDGATIWTATRNLDGSISRGFSFAGADRSPQVATTPDGSHTMVLWQSAQTLQSAALTPGSLRTENVATSGVSGSRSPLLVIDATGRATAAWIAGPVLGTAAAQTTLLVSSHAPGGRWSEPTPLAAGVSSPAMAIDSAGDVVVAYWLPLPGSASSGSAPGAVWATTLPSGAAAWSTPEIVSGSEQVFASEPAVAGGGARTFVVNWSRSDLQPVLRTARLRFPGAWEPPRDVVAAGFAPPGFTYPESWRGAVDSFGNALMVLRFPTLEYGFALATARLPATAGEWSAPTALDLPGHRYWSDSQPAVALAGDGSATVAFLQRRNDGISLRVATASGPSGTWATTDAAWLSSCSYGAHCASEWDVAPVIAVGSRATTVAVQTWPGVVVALSRAEPGGPWSRPVTLQGFGSTQVYLRSAHVRKGYIRVYAGCALPPCRGVVVVRTTGKAQRVLARVEFALGGSRVESAPVLLSRWARAQLKHGGRLRMQFVLDVSAGDGSTARAQRTVLLHN